MKGLLIKEVLSMKTYSKIMIILGVFYLVFGLMQKNASAFVTMFSFVPVLMVLIIGMNSIALDDSTKWNAFAVCMPLRRRDIVKSKYIYLILSALAYSVCFLLMAVVVQLIFPDGNLLQGLSSIGASFCLSLLLCSVTLPLLYKFGVEKARFIIMAAVMIPALCIGFLPTLIKNNPLEGIVWEDYLWCTALIPVVCILLYLLSYTISVHIFEKKEL